MVFESVRGYVELASELSDITRARAAEAAQGLVSLPAAGVASGTKMAAQASALADELLAVAVANRSNLTELVRSEVDLALARLGLVPVLKLEEAQAEAARLRSEVDRLRSASSKAAASKAGVPKAGVPKGTASKSAAKKATAPRSAAKKATAPRSAAKKATAPRSTAKKTAASTAAASTAAASTAAAPTAAAPTAPQASAPGRTSVSTRATSAST